MFYCQASLSEFGIVNQTFASGEEFMKHFTRVTSRIYPIAKMSYGHLLAV